MPASPAVLAAWLLLAIAMMDAWPLRFMPLGSDSGLELGLWLGLAGALIALTGAAMQPTPRDRLRRSTSE